MSLAANLAATGTTLNINIGAVGYGLAAIGPVCGESVRHLLPPCL